MSNQYAVWVERDRTGLYTAIHPQLLGCRGQGATAEEAMADLDVARGAYLAALARAEVEAPRPAEVFLTERGWVSDEVLSAEQIAVIDALAQQAIEEDDADRTRSLRDFAAERGMELE
jgi:predicted RNase H-like HicB family nuclease